MKSFPRLSNLTVVETFFRLTDYKYHLHDIITFFINHKKLDDLADSFLQGLYWINFNKLILINLN